MGKQYNKAEKRRRRLSYLKRKKEAAKTKKPEAQPAAPPNP
jgi:hypothetical protein